MQATRIPSTQHDDGQLSLAHDLEKTPTISEPQGSLGRVSMSVISPTLRRLASSAGNPEFDLRQ